MAYPQSGASEIKWIEDLEEAAQLAKTEGKMLMLHFWGHRCQPCKNLEIFVFNRPDVAEAIYENVIPVKINVESRGDLVKKYQVTSMPTDVLTTADGVQLSKRNSPRDAPSFIKMVKSFGTFNKKETALVEQINENYVTAASESELTSSERQARYELNLNEQVQRTQSQLNLGQEKTGEINNGGGQFLRSVNALGTSSKLPTGEPTGETTNSPASLARTQIQRTIDSGKNQFDFDVDRIRSGTESAAADLNAGQQNIEARMRLDAITANTEFDHAHVVTVDQAEQQSRSAANQSNGSNQTSSSQTPQPSSTSGRIVNPMAFQNSKDLALEGHCPVSLINQETWVKGDASWGCVHRGKTYVFASKEYRDVFQMAPDAYSPLLSGNDPVIFQESGRLVEGERKFGAFFGGNEGPKIVVLFREMENRRKFEADPARYIKTVRQAMNTLDRETIYR
ncbi:MAG TPA: thioredoxin family protein [Pirellulaceae bacterium]|nr:thioredoxin family protein [Pirellulaceae bacterium]HMO90855.1 thioredoxin family protein [Pirellulaceae bacterium]HMP68669.1 thioredoxin family protein [Pirellulaceae bacterium]